MVEKADSQKELWEEENLVKNPIPALRLTFETNHRTGEARSEGYKHWECVRSVARDFCLGCQIKTDFVLFYVSPS